MVVRGIGKASLHQIVSAPAICAGTIESLLMLMSMHRPARA